ncbi:MAG: FAD-dependent oxidoreductase [Candidatus Pacebacteria bacterium]|nr:FAD-dependent oxidoreductase [Candidatus Paceibacterota bacterium]
MFDLVIIGGGPAATAAAVYAARKQLKTILIAGEFGGQSNVSTDIQNWIGTPHISGADLAKSFKTHVMEYAGDILTVKEGVLANGIEGKAGAFSVSTSTGEKIESRSVLVATGSKRRALEIAGAKEYENKGLTYCASCDGPMFSGEDVIVIGGGNAAFETAAQLLAYCKSVTLINRSATLRADEITVAQTKKDSKFKLITEVDLVNVYGGDFVEGMTIKYADGKEEKIGAKGIFVEIGQLPNSDFARNLVEVTMGGQIKIDPKTQKTSVEGIWSAGDVTDVLYHQNNIAAGDAVRALEDIYLWLHRTK